MNSTVAYFSYQDGRQNGMISILNVAKARAKINYPRKIYYEDFSFDYLISASGSQLDIVDDIMAIAKKYEEECKGSEPYTYYGNTYRVANDCLEKLKEKHYLVSYPYNSETATVTFLQL